MRYRLIALVAASLIKALEGDMRGGVLGFNPAILNEQAADNVKCRLFDLSLVLASRGACYWYLDDKAKVSPLL